MKSLVVYSSRTGNTKKVAKAIFDILPAMKILSTVEHAPPPEDFDLIALGFWIDRGYPDADAQRYMQMLHGKKVAIFGTLGTYNDIDYVVACQKRAKENLRDNTILGTFFCQGKVAPDVVDLISRTYRMTTDQRARIEEAHDHPNAEDLFHAQEAFRDIMATLPI